MIHRKVIFQDKLLWLHNETDDEGGAVLSPLKHYSEEGELLAHPFLDVSWAVIEGQEIRRHQQTIGHVQDLIDAQEIPQDEEVDLQELRKMVRTVQIALLLMDQKVKDLEQAVRGFSGQCPPSLTEGQADDS